MTTSKQDESRRDEPTDVRASARFVTAILRRVWRASRLIVARALGARGPRRKLVLLLGLATIIVWQNSFTWQKAKLDDSYRLTASSGMHNEPFFVYFLWYTGLFPVSSTLAHPPCDYRCTPNNESMAPAALSVDAAERVILTRPDTLVMDSSWTWYAGDRGKIFLFYLDAWLKGVPWKPSVKPMHRLVFIVALGSLFYAFWRERRPLLGALVVLFLGSNPFQLFEVNVNENVFSWNITLAILLLAIHLPLLTQRRVDPRWAYVWPIATAVLMATVRTIRSEPMPMLAAAVGSYLVVRFQGTRNIREVWLRRASLVATFFVVFLLGHAGWTRYFADKHEVARTKLAAIGGHPFPGNVRMYHHFWHPVWCGLGDFDKTHGYVWDDFKALEYAKPILESKFHEYVPSGSWRNAPKNSDEFWDDQGLYKKLPYDIPHYSDVIRDKVLSDIRREPGWYANILYQRLKRVLFEATPVRLTGWRGWWEVPVAVGKLFLPLAALMIALRSRLGVALLLFTLPTLTTAVLVYSDRGVVWYGVFHLLAAAIVVAIFIELVQTVIRGWRKRRAH